MTNKTQSEPLSDPALRITRLRDILFQKNSARMAAEVGCSRSLLSRVVAGTQKPGRRLLQAIATLPNVNAEWLLNGVGEPLLKARDPHALAGTVLPVTHRLFDGAPSDNEAHLTGEYFPVAAAFHRPSRYWLRIEDASRGMARDVRLEAGDLLLMESDRTYWPTPEHVHKRLGVVRDSTASVPGLCRLSEIRLAPESNAEPSILTADYFLQGPFDPRMKEVPTDTQSQKKSRLLKQRREMGAIELNDVIALAVHLVRRFEWPGSR